jgi:Sec7-like guanine-nucleotide exchange factor
MDNPLSNVAAQIFNLAREMKLDVGHVFRENVFRHTLAQSFNPKERKEIPPAWAELTDERGYFERRANGYFLTQAGFDALYG